MKRAAVMIGVDRPGGGLPPLADAASGAKRMTPGVRWCSSRTLFATAFPDIVAGLTVLSKNAVQEAVVGRAVEHLLAASGNEALDVRVPIACSGLEMLGSAVLARQGKDVPENAACKLRQLLAADGVCATIPKDFGNLSARRSRGHSDAVRRGPQPTPSRASRTRPWHANPAVIWRAR